MNKLLTKISALVLGAAMLFGVGVSGVKASEEVRAAELGSAEILSCTAGTIYDNAMSFSTDSFNIVCAKGESSNFASYSPWRVYNKNTISVSSKDGSTKIGKVEFIHSGTYYGTIQCTNPTGGSVAMASSSGGTSTWTIDESSAKTSVSFINSNSSQARFSSIKIYPYSSSEPANPSVNSVSINPSALQLDLNGNNTGTITSSVDAVGGASTAVNWTIENANPEGCITVDNGAVTAVSVGTATVRATSAFDNSKSATCSVIVIDTTPPEGSIIASTTIGAYAEEKSWADATKYTTLVLDENITVKVTGGGNTGKYYNSGKDWRIYQNESPSILVSGGDGVVISSIKITYNINNTGLLLDENDNGVDSGSVVSVNAGSYTFGVGNSLSDVTKGQVRITAIEVCYTLAEPAELESIVVSGTLETSTVYVSDSWNPVGLVATGYYDDETTKDLTATVEWEFSPANPEAMGVGENQTLTITATYNDVTSSEYTQTVSVIAPSTIEATVAEAIEVCKSVSGDNVSTTDIYVVTGYITVLGSWSTQYNNVDISIADSSSETDVSKMLKIYRFNDKDVYDTLVVGAKIKVTSKLTKYNTTYETVAGQSTIELLELPADEDTTNYGTADLPISVTEALAIADEQCAVSGAFSRKKVYVTGLVIDQPDYSGSYIKTFNLQNDDDALIVYSCNKTDGVSEPDQNDTVVINGYIKNHEGTIEIAANGSDYPVMVSNIRGSSTISVASDSSEYATVNLSSSTATNGTTLTFTVDVETGHELVSVKVNNALVEPDSGVYSIDVHGNMDITVQTRDTSAEPEVSVYEKVTSTSDITDGRYLIVYEAGSVALDGSLTSDVASNYQSIEIESNAITLDSYDDTFYVNIEKVNDAYSISTTGGEKTIGHTGSKNTLNYGDALSNTISINEDGTAVIDAGDYVLRFNANSGQERFRFYKSGQEAVTLYKLAEETDEYLLSDFVTDFNTVVAAKCDPAGVNSSISSTDWEDLASKWSEITDSKDSFVTEVGADEATLQAISAYDYIVGKYSWANDFASRGSSAAPVVHPILSDSSTITSIVTVIAVASITMVGAFTFVRKRKEH